MARPARQLAHRPLAEQLVFPAPSVVADTSEAAAASLSGETLGRLRARVLAHFRDVQSDFDDGRYERSTADAVEAALNGRHQTISARVRELVQLGYLFDSGHRAATRSGRSARVYALTLTGFGACKRLGDDVAADAAHAGRGA